jgi:hypothetical protein
VLAPDVEGGGAAAVALAAGPPGDLEGDQVLPLHRAADRGQPGDVRVVGGQALELVPQAARPAVGTEHAVRGRGAGRRPRHGLGPQGDAVAGERVRLPGGQDDLDRGRRRAGAAGVAGATSCTSTPAARRAPSVDPVSGAV